MLAKRADKVVGQRLAFVNVAAYLANVALLAFGFGLGFNVFVVVSVGHCLSVGKHSRLGNGANKHSVCVKVYILLDLTLVSLAHNALVCSESQVYRVFLYT